MKDKKNIVIIILLLIIFFGSGYFFGNTNSKEKAPSTKGTSSTVSESTQNTTSSIRESSTSNSSFKDVEANKSTDDISINKQSQPSKSDIAFEKMMTLQGKWAVWQSDNNFTIHEDGSWTNKPAGPGGDRVMNVKVVDYDETTNTLNLVIEDDYTQIHIQNDKKIIMESGKNGGSSTFILIE